MAKKSKSNKIKINFKGVESRKLVPENEYVIGVESIKQEKGDAGPYLAWEYKITEGEHKGALLYNNTSLSTKALWNLRNVLECHGVDVPDSVLELDLDELLDSDEVGCYVEQSTWQGKRNSKIVEIFMADDVQTEGEGDGGEEEVEIDVSEMKKKELQEVVDEYDLDVDLSDHKKIGDKRDAVAEALEALNEEGGDGDDEAEVDLEEMDFEELSELIDDRDLDLDIDDFKDNKKGLKKLRAAIEEELEEVGDGEEEGGEATSYSRDEIESMKAKELKAVIEEAELDVEADGVKAKKLRKLVCEALDDEDLLDE